MNSESTQTPSMFDKAIVDLLKWEGTKFIANENDQIYQ
jgi:hypothetical protein